MPENDCNHAMIWVNKYSDMDVPEVDQNGTITNKIEWVDVNFYRCKLCGFVRADAD